MKLLLDTNAFYWCDQDPNRLSDPAKRLIQDATNELYLSVVSVWEMSIKQSIGKLILHDPLPEIVRRQVQVNGLRILPVTLDHVFRLDGLPFHHKDPFDRLIIAQAISDSLTVLTSDEMFAKYPLPIEW